jgi:MFS family permease
MRWIEKGLPSAGLYVGALSWMASTQANYALVPVACAHQGVWLVPMLSFGLAVLSILGGLLSWRALPAQHLHPDYHAGGKPHRFLAIIGMGSAVLFAAVILLQGVAGVVLQGCER